MRASRLLRFSDVSPIGVDIQTNQPLSSIFPHLDEEIQKTAKLIHKHIYCLFRNDQGQSLKSHPLSAGLQLTGMALQQLYPRKTPMLSDKQRHNILPSHLKPGLPAPNPIARQVSSTAETLLCEVYWTLDSIPSIKERLIPNVRVASGDLGKDKWYLRPIPIYAVRHGTVNIKTPNEERKRCVKEKLQVKNKTLAIIHCTSRERVAPKENIAQEISRIVAYLTEKYVSAKDADPISSSTVKALALTFHTEFLYFSVLEFPTSYLKRANSSTWRPDERDEPVKFMMSEKFNLLEEDGLLGALEGIVALMTTKGGSPQD